MSNLPSKSTTREYRNYDAKIKALREAAASDETERVLRETRQLTLRSEDQRLVHTISLPDFSMHHGGGGGGGVIMRARSPGPPSPYSRSPSLSPVRSPSPRVVMLPHREGFRPPGGSGNTLQIPAGNNRQRSASDSNISYTQETVPIRTQEMGLRCDIINTSTYTSPQSDPPVGQGQRVRVIIRSPSLSRRKTVPVNYPSPLASDLAQTQERKTSLPVGSQPNPEIIVYEPEQQAGHSNLSSDLQEQNLHAQLGELIRSGSMDGIFENLHINSHNNENESSNLSPNPNQGYNFQTSCDLSNNGVYLMPPSSDPLLPVLSPEFVVNNPPSMEEEGSTEWDADEILRHLK